MTALNPSLTPKYAARLLVVSLNAICGAEFDSRLRSLNGLVVPIPTLPLEPMIVRADVEVVAVPATVVVARYRLPPAFLNAHCAMPAPSESASCEAVVEATVKA